MFGSGTPSDVCGSVVRRRVMSCIGKMQEETKSQPLRIEKHRDNAPSFSGLTPKTALLMVHMTDVRARVACRAPCVSARRCLHDERESSPKDTHCISRPQEGSNPRTNTFCNGISP